MNAAAREDTMERLERALKLTHKKSLTVTIPRLTAERAVSLLKEQEKRINELEEKLRLLEYGDLDTLQSAMMPAT